MVLEPRSPEQSLRHLAGGEIQHGAAAPNTVSPKNCVLQPMPHPPSNRIGLPLPQNETPEEVSQERLKQCCPLLSVIVPAYNEAESIAESLDVMTTYLTGAGIDYEIIVVSDGSTDGTADIVRQRSVSDRRLRVIAYEENRGKGYAVHSGMATAVGRYVMFIDADLTVPISIVPEFLDVLDNGYDIAIASRRHPASNQASLPLARRLMGQVFSWLVRRLIVSDVGDTQCGGKAYRGEVAQRLFAAQQIDHFSFDAEVLFLARRAGYRIKEVPVTLDYHESSSIRPLRDSLRMLRDLLRIRFHVVRGDYG